ncbi:DUF3742 family protein [Pseudomonas aeruginosa]|uniref:DUF3742 family protein n=1 Tax=Pseudomonas aeruginosa TaxID=287 RepID=UPI003FD16EB0
MDTKARISNAERFGRRIGGVWRGFVRREHQVAGWLVARGLSAGAATALLWGVKLAVLAVLLYVAFWFALMVVFVLLVVRGLAQSTQDEDLGAQKDELRHGEAGYGLYSSSGQRIDPHDPNNPYDQ